MRVLCKACMVVFPALICGILLLNHYRVAIPLKPIVPVEKLLSWLIYQCVCVAFAEEVFFRGHLQSNIQHFLASVMKKRPAISAMTSIVISAFIFALFHSLVFRNAVSLITFFPGLIFGWLFIRTKSLLAPVLFHGLDNIVYGFPASLLA